MYHMLKAVVILCLYTTVKGVIYPTFDWIYSNPKFKNSNGAILYVQPFSQVNILCPHPAMIVVEQQFTHFLNNLYENIWLVDKEGYDKCEVNKKKVLKKTHRLLGVCNSPARLSYHTLAFEMFSLHESGMFGIKKGETYYLISTSRGNSRSLRKRKNGHCKTHNMRLRIYVCKGKTDPICVNQRRISASGNCP